MMSVIAHAWLIRLPSGFSMPISYYDAVELSSSPRNYYFLMTTALSQVVEPNEANDTVISLVGVFSRAAFSVSCHGLLPFSSLLAGTRASS